MVHGCYIITLEKLLKRMMRGNCICKNAQNAEIYQSQVSFLREQWYKMM